MNGKLVSGAALALVLGSGAALADATDQAADVDAIEAQAADIEHVTVHVDGDPVRVPVAIAAVACDMEAEEVAEYVGTDEVVCEIDQATAEELEIPEETAEEFNLDEDVAADDQNED